MADNGMKSFFQIFGNKSYLLWVMLLYYLYTRDRLVLITAPVQASAPAVLVVPPIPISTPLPPTFTLPTIWTTTPLSTLRFVAAVVAILAVASRTSTAVAFEAIVVVLVSPFTSPYIVAPPVTVNLGLLAGAPVGRLCCGVAVDDEVVDY